MISVWTDASPGWTTYGAEQTENAADIYAYLTGNGVTSNAAYAIIGNMQKESSLNPGQWQYGSNYDPSMGFGLGQWTPSTKISNITGTGQNQMSDYQAQLQILLNDPGQWSTVYVNQQGWSFYYNINVPHIATMNDFLTDTTHSVEELTKAWCCCWERPAAAYADISSRVDYAAHWSGQSPSPTPGITPIVMLCVLAKAAIKWRFKL